MAGSRTASALLLLLAASAFNGCWAKDFKFIFGQGGDGGDGGTVVQMSKTTQAGIANAAKTLQKANANGGNGGNGVNLKSKDFPDYFVVAGAGGNGGNGGTVYQKSVTTQAGAFNSASTTQTANANGGDGGAGVNGRKLLRRKDLPDFLVLVGKGGDGGDGGVVVQYSKTTQAGLFNKAKTTQKASANGGKGGNGIGRKLLDDNSIFVFGQGGDGGDGGFIGQFSATKQLGFFNKAKTTQKAKANGGNGGNGVGR